MSYPIAEIEVDEALVRVLLERECPELARDPILRAGEGWDNFIFRLGASHAVRLPRRAAAVPLIVNEQRWLPGIGRRLAIEIPAPVHAASGGDLFPWPWSVVCWVSGSTAEAYSFTARDVSVLAESLRGLHQLTTGDAPANSFRSVPLRERASRMVEMLGHHSRAASHFDVPAARRIWESALAADAPTDRRLIHGDLHPRNVIVREGAFVGIIDWGDLCAGDVATDVACAWLLIGDSHQRDAFLQAYGASAALRARARGWALYLGLALEGSGQADHVTLGWETIRRVLGDTSSP